MNKTPPPPWGGGWGVGLAMLLGSTACADVRLGAAEYLWGLWLIPLLILFYVYTFRTKRRLLERFASPTLLAQLTTGVSKQRQIIKACLMVLGFGLAVLSLAQVRYGFTWENVRRRGVDVVVALDTSDSMLVQDAAGEGKLSRLERAKREIVDLLKLMEGDRIALVAFAGTAFVECPLTLDYSAAAVFLDDIDTDLIPVKGTAIDEAIRTSVKVLDGSPRNAQAIILITDGEDHSGDALKAADEAKERGIRIFTIGIGRNEGAPIPAPGGGFRRDERGELVLSRLDETTLQKIALDTGGRYVRSMTGDVDLESIYKNGIKALLTDQELGSKRRQRWEERFQWVLGLAIVILAGEALLPERMRRKATKQSAAAALLLGLWLTPWAGHTDPPPAPNAPAGGVPSAAAPGAAGPGPATANPTAPASRVKPHVVRIHDPYEAYETGAYDQALQGFIDLQVEHPSDPALMLNVANSHYKMGNFADAEKAFSQAALNGDAPQREQALYGLGNCAYRQGKLDEALKRYQAALDINPDDPDAKFNIEFVRDEIRRRVEEAQKQQKENPQQQQQQGNQGEQSQSNPQQQGQQGQQNQQQGQNNEANKDTDGDGLSDDQEKHAQNPTDPHKQDTDGDGIPDGKEDANHNGKVDTGETDPTKPDNGKQGAGAQGGAQEGGEQGSGSAQGQPGQGMTKEEAERYLDGVNETRPKHGTPNSKAVRRGPGGKDW